MVVDLLGVVPGDGRVAEQAAEKPGAGVGDLVQRQPRPGEFGEDRQQAGAGGRFEHEIGRGQRRRLGGDEAERDRRRELLEALGFLGAARLRRQPLGEPGQHVEHRGGRARAGAHGVAEFAQEQDLRRFAGLVGVLPHPGSLRIGGAEGGLHRRAQGAAVERAALPQQLREQGRGMKKPRDLVGRGLRQEQREGCRGRRRGGGCGRHARDLRRAGARGDPAKRSLSSFGSHLPLRPSPSSRLHVPPDQPGELAGPVQQIERGEVVAAAGVIAPALAGPEQDAGVAAGRRLARLHVETIAMQRRFTRNGDAARFERRSYSSVEAERRGEREEPPPRLAVKEALLAAS